MTECEQCGPLLGEKTAVCSQCGPAADASLVPEPRTPASALPLSLADRQVSHTAPISSEMDQSGDRRLTGIGGWLILLVIGLAVGPLLALSGIVPDSKVLFGSKGQAVLAASPGLEAAYLFDLITNFVLLTALIWLNFMFFRKKKAFPTYMILYLVTQFVSLLAVYLIAMRFIPSTSPAEAIRSFVICLIWIPYFLKSRRVQLTFIR